MLRNNPRSWIAIAAICLSVVVITNFGPARGNQSEEETEVARDEIDEDEEFDEDAARREFRELQEQLERIELEIEEAEEVGDRDLVDELRVEGERILDELDELQRLFGIEEFEGDEGERDARRRDLEIHLQNLELERSELELRIGRLELVRQMAEVAGSSEGATAFAIMYVEEHMEPEVAIDFLEEMLANAESDATRRLIHIKLAHLYPHVEQPGAAREHLELLILGE